MLIWTTFGTLNYGEVFAKADAERGRGHVPRHRAPALHGGDGQVGPVPAVHVAARRHGRPDAGVGPHPRRHHGDGGRVHGGALPQALRDGARCRSRSWPGSARSPRSSPRPSASPRPTSRGCWPTRRSASSATCSRRSAWAPTPWPSSTSSAHAFFKALLFLGAGSVIHGLRGRAGHAEDGRPRPAHDDHDRDLPRRRASASPGVPPFAGFFSKDEILAAAWNAGHRSIWVLLLVGAFMTAFYTFRRRLPRLLRRSADVQRGRPSRPRVARR